MKKLLVIMCIMLFSISIFAQSESKIEIEPIYRGETFFGTLYSFESQRAELYPGFGLFYGQTWKNDFGFYVDATYINQDSRYGYDANSQSTMFHVGYLEKAKQDVVYWYVGAGASIIKNTDKNKRNQTYKKSNRNGQYR